jgi:hypothetical protein
MGTDRLSFITSSRDEPAMILRIVKSLESRSGLIQLNVHSVVHFQPFKGTYQDLNQPSVPSWIPH